MHRNTYLLVIILAVFAALVVGVNIGKTFQPPSSPQPTPNPIVSKITLSPTPTVRLQTYTNTTCGISFDYPSTSGAAMTVATSAAILADPANPNGQIAIACQKDIPRIPLSPDKIDKQFVPRNDHGASISANLYHTATPKDGSPLDVLLFTNPKTGLDVFLSGAGATFTNLIASLKII